MIRFLVFCLLAFAPVCACFGQDSTPAGGSWLRIEGIEPAWSRKVTSFVLPAEEADLGRSPQIQIICDGDGKFIQARYFADTDVFATTGDYKHYDDPAMQPKIRLDKRVTIEPVWDLIPSKWALIDPGTLKKIIHSQEMRIQFRDKYYNRFIDAYATGGLNIGQVIRACGRQKWLQ